jgi:hypothetical protein
MSVHLSGGTGSGYLTRNVIHICYFVLLYLIFACIEQNEKKIIIHISYNISLRDYFCEEKTLQNQCTEVSSHGNGSVVFQYFKDTQVRRAVGGFDVHLD